MASSCSYSINYLSRSTTFYWEPVMARTCTRSGIRRPVLVITRQEHVSSGCTQRHVTVYTSQPEIKPHIRHNQNILTSTSDTMRVKDKPNRGRKQERFRPRSVLQGGTAQQLHKRHVRQHKAQREHTASLLTE